MGPPSNSPMPTTKRTAPLTTTKRLPCSRVRVNARAKNATPQHEQCTNAATNARHVRNGGCPQPEPSHCWRPADGPVQQTECRRPCSEHRFSTSGRRLVETSSQHAQRSTHALSVCDSTHHQSGTADPHAPIFNVGAGLRKQVLRNLRRSLSLRSRAVVHGQH